jgi:putative ABC transport system ATP-binding protein
LEKPAVLLADEPTGNLDSVNSAEIMNYFQKINKAGQTILMVTHDPNIGQAAPRHLVMKDGCIIQDTAKGVDA